MGDEKEDVVLLCKDCAKVKVSWLNKLTGNYEDAKCLRRVNTVVDPVSGKVKVTMDFLSCREERRASNSWACGAKGRMWEPGNTKAATFAALKKHD